MLQALIDRVRGRMRVRTSGGDVPAFLNKCMARGIPLRRIARTPDGGLSCFAPLRLEKQLEKAAGECSLELRVSEKTGFKLFLKKVYERRTLPVCAAIFAALLFASGFFVWDVRITGECGAHYSEIRRALELAGVKPGVLRSSIVPRLAGNEILLAVPELEWAVVNLSGGTVVVTVWQDEPRLERSQPETACDMISDREGVVEKTFFLSGRGMVKKGDVVRAGDILASGTLEDNQGEIRKVACRGYVLLRTWRTFSAVLPKNASVGRVSKEAKAYSLAVLGRIFTLSALERADLSCYDIYSEITGEGLFSSVLCRHTVRRITPSPVSVPKNRAEQMLKKDLDAYMALFEDCEILSYTDEFTERDGVYVLERKAECLEKAGAFRPLGQ